MRRRSSVLLCLAAACGGAPPQVHYYQLVVAPALHRPQAELPVTLAIEPLAVDAAYATDRIVYRQSPYRLDYYHYHRWSAVPALHLGDVLRDAYFRSGAFEQVTLEPLEGPGLLLRGRVLALEEVDESESRWLARLGIILTLHDAATGDLMWSESFREEEALAEQSPEGLARALSVATQRVVQRSMGPITVAAQGLIAAGINTSDATVDRRAGCPRRR